MKDTYRLVLDEENGNKTLSVRRMIYDENISPNGIPVDYSEEPITIDSSGGTGAMDKHIEVCRAMEQKPLKGGENFPQVVSDEELEDLYENTQLFI